jgi:chromosome segregation ATPase
MKTKIVIILLAVAVVGLAIALVATKKQSDEQHAVDVQSINTFSNQIVEAKIQVEDLSQANLTLTNDLALSRQQTADLSNSLAAADTTLASTKTTLIDAQTQVTNLNLQIADLEAQNKVLDDRATELTNTIAHLNDMIDQTSIQLAIAETNRDFLSSELQKQMAQKADLEHKFGDLDEVRAQVRKLKDALYVARRVQLMKYDNSNKHGAEFLLNRPSPPAAASNLPPNYDLNVEVGSDGSVKVIPPISPTNSDTNSAAH